MLKLAGMVTSALLTAAFFLEKNIPLNKFSLSYIQKTGAYPYVVLALCILMLYLKRERIISDMQKKTSLLYVIIGISFAILSIVLPSGEPHFLVFALLLLWLGIFTTLFGKAALLPLALLGIYGFAIVFPMLISGLSLYPLATTIILVTLLSPFLTISNHSQTIYFLDNAGVSQTYFIDSGCSGSASLALFLSIFLLMMLDSPLFLRKSGYMLIFGLAGTYLQNILRLAVLVFAGYWHGSNALWTAHAYAGYIIFPIWYTLFAYVYLKQAKEDRRHPWLRASSV